MDKLTLDIGQEVLEIVYVDFLVVNDDLDIVQGWDTTHYDAQVDTWTVS